MYCIVHVLHTVYTTFVLLAVTSDGTTVLIPKATSEEQNKAVPISTLPGDAATSLIELSQVRE